MNITANRQYKDRLFKLIFGSPDRKDWSLSLYNAVNGSKYEDPNELQIYTIENALYMQMHNDVSYLIDNVLSLFEEQSTFNPNMPLRGLFYFSSQYEKFVKQNKKNLYSSGICEIPTPQYYIFYIGREDRPETEVLRLSDAFITEIDDPAIEVKATVININEERNVLLKESCKPLSDYSKFVNYVRINQEQGNSIDEAVQNAVDRAIDENLLDGYFAIHEAEVIGVILEEYNEEETLKLQYQEGQERGREEGLKQGLEQGQAQEHEAMLADLKLDSEQYDQLIKAINNDPELLKRTLKELK